MDTTTDTIDRLDMTVEDIIDEGECVNCLGPVDEFGTNVEGWGEVCEHCHADLWDARLAQAF